jgi:hypothetical protein
MTEIIDKVAASSSKRDFPHFLYVFMYTPCMFVCMYV